MQQFDVKTFVRLGELAPERLILLLYFKTGFPKSIFGSNPDQTPIVILLEAFQHLYIIQTFQQ